MLWGGSESRWRRFGASPETLHALQTVPQMLSVRECGERVLHTPREGDVYGLVWSDFAPHGVQSPFLSRCVEHRRSTQVFVSRDVEHVACGSSAWVTYAGQIVG